MKRDELSALIDRAFLFYEHEAETYKDTTHAVLKFTEFYGKLPHEDRQIADAILIDWSLSGDEKKRFMALAVIEDLSITSAIPTLRSLAEHFEHSNDPGAPSNWAWVNRIIGNLVTATDQ